MFWQRYLLRTICFNSAFSRHGTPRHATPRALMVYCPFWSHPCQVIPVQHANALDGVPRIAAVFQNDCLYLAHHMITLGYEFRQGLPPPANQTATMIDTVPLFRELAAQRCSEQTSQCFWHPKRTTILTTQSTENIEVFCFCFCFLWLTSSHHPKTHGDAAFGLRLCGIVVQVRSVRGGLQARSLQVFLPCCIMRRQCLFATTGMRNVHTYDVSV